MRELIGRLYDLADYLEPNDALAAKTIRQAIAVLTMHSQELPRALEALVEPAPARDAKWAGMNAKDIAHYALGLIRCPSCGATNPGASPYCSNGFHAPRTWEERNEPQARTRA